MLEISMLVCLTLMGIYFFKSTDLPKELQERSAQLRVETEANNFQIQAKRINLERQMSRINELAALNKNLELDLINKEINRLTILITTLEQEIRDNNQRNTDIQKTIDTHLIKLQELQNKISTLA